MAIGDTRGEIGFGQPVAFDPPETEMKVSIPTPLRWKVLIEPLKPKDHYGDLVMTEKSQSDQEYGTVVGQIVSMGETAFTSEKLADQNNPAIGDWVLYPVYGGQRVDMADGRVYVVIDDDKIHSVVADPEPYRKKIV